MIEPKHFFLNFFYFFLLKTKRKKEKQTWNHFACLKAARASRQGSRGSWSSIFWTGCSVAVESKVGCKWQGVWPLNEKQTFVLIDKFSNRTNSNITNLLLNKKYKKFEIKKKIYCQSLTFEPHNPLIMEDLSIHLVIHVPLHHKASFNFHEFESSFSKSMSKLCKFMVKNPVIHPHCHFISLKHYGWFLFFVFLIFINFTIRLELWRCLAMYTKHFLLFDAI